MISPEGYSQDINQTNMSKFCILSSRIHSRTNPGIPSPENICGFSFRKFLHFFSDWFKYISRIFHVRFLYFFRNFSSNLSRIPLEISSGIPLGIASIIASRLPSKLAREILQRILRNLVKEFLQEYLKNSLKNYPEDFCENFCGNSSRIPLKNAHLTS